MKKLSIFALLFALLLPVLAFGQDYSTFLHKNSLPNPVNYLPAPPTTDSEDFKGDLFHYLEGKAARATERGQQAIDDSHLYDLVKIFSEPMGIRMSTEKTPKLANIIGRTMKTATESTTLGKKHFARKRPYAEFNEPSLIPEDEKRHNPNASYPSGHSTAGWAVALVLVEINPKAQDALLKRGYEIGESRVIAGFHYESDVNMGRIVASAAIARLHADPEFEKMLKEAKQEFNDLSKKSDSNDAGNGDKNRKNKGKGKKSDPFVLEPFK